MKSKESRQIKLKLKRRASRIRPGFIDYVDKVDTPCTCSRYCCGNSRRWFAGKDKFTMQERKATASADFQCKDIQDKTTET